MLVKSLALAGLLSLASTAAFAQTLVTASLNQPLSKPVEVIASDVLWNCEGAACRAQVDEERAPSVSLCRDLTKRVGAVSGYSYGAAAFATDQLAKCNVGRTPLTTAQVR